MLSIKNFKNGLITTLLGIVCWASAICSVFWQDNITWTDALVPFILGIALILMPDKVSGILRKILGKYTAVILLVLLGACKTSKPTTPAPPTAISTKVSVTATVPKDSAVLVIPVDRLRVDSVTTFQSAGQQRVTGTVQLRADKSLEIKCKCDSAQATNQATFTPIIPEPITLPCAREHAGDQNWITRNVLPAFKQAILIILATLLLLSGYKYWLTWYNHHDNDKYSF
ncbi:hypothetical protein [Adhaeribacter pallidiroseus]|uniref:Uncharacterized protein n=1 Tax=Adhaeribacter pallidiroseus TaxID=2072847 RepID=A0A369QL13_9BACT|nr:hypothetical protein [Adhaeribacter pallidiroseus]RDC65072.1 hypothetical protein AHMF7616_03695 [Adhaeribacter pallidiroseus]